MTTSPVNNELPRYSINLDSLKGLDVSEAKERIKGTRWHDVIVVDSFGFGISEEYPNPVVLVTIDNEGKIDKIKPSVN